MASKTSKTGKASKATTGTALAPVTGTAIKLPEGIKAVRRVTMPSLALKNPGDEKILCIADAMRVSAVKDKSEQKREPATICSVGDVLTGEMYTYIVPAVVKSNLLRDYPDDSYVGKSFHIKNMGRRNENQRYNDFSIIEVDPSGLTS